MEEPSTIVRWTIDFFAGGDAGILATLSIAVSAILSLSPLRRRPVRPFLAFAALTVGLMVFACSPAPFPVWFQVLTGICLGILGCSICLRHARTNTQLDQAGHAKLSVTCLIWFLSPVAWLTTAFTIELPFHFWVPPQRQVTRLMVIGDSVTAGLNDGEDTWPRKLSRKVHVEIWDASQPGATLRSARQQNTRFSQGKGLVILEIGGNDLLEGLPVARFEEELDRLLTDVVQPDRDVVMFELPLPPLCARYGAAQRRQAMRHRVRLIPKRMFAKVLTSSGSTVDGIHLAPEGHSRMAKLIELLFSDRFVTSAESYQRLERIRN